MLAAFDKLGAPLGFTPHEFRFISSLVLVYPLSVVHRLLPHNPTLKHFYSALAGVLIAAFCFQWDCLHFIAATSVTYFLMVISRKYSGWLVLCYNMIHLTWGNYDRMMGDYLGYSLNWTLPQMILTCKLSSLAWSYYDGGVSNEQIDKEMRGKDTFRKAHQVKQLPSILEVFGYAFFFPGFLTGPWADFKEYTNFTDMSAFESVGGTIPSPVGFLIKRLIMVGVAFVGYSFAPKFPVTMVITDEFMLNPFWYRLVMYFLAVELFYMKYYVVWWLGEGAAATVGIAFNGIDEKGNPKWDRMPMVDLITFKFGTNGTRDQTPSWNMPAQKWLKRYIHIRLVHLGLNTSQARLLTFITSAVWHGLYPGYYVFFVWCALFVEVGGMSRVVFWPLVTEADGKTPKKPLIYVWNAISMILLSGAVDYLAISFQLMAFESGWKAFKSVYFIGHIVWGLLMLSYFVKVICCRGKKPGKALGVNGTKHD